MIEGCLQTPDLKEALHCLVQEARTEGGIDNITSSWPMSWTGQRSRHHPAGGPWCRCRARHPLGRSQDPRRRQRGHHHLRTAGRSSHRRAEPDDESRYSPRPPHRRRAVRPLAALVAAALIAAAVLGGAYAWTRTQYFVGVAEDQVAIFRGLSDSLPGIKLSSVYEIQPLPGGRPAAVLPRQGAGQHRCSDPLLGPPDRRRAG